MKDGTPPGWAHDALSLILKRRDQETIAGDLLEEYRQQSADGQDARNWYLRQVIAFAWRWSLPTAVLLTLTGFGRFLLDVLSPPANFVSRSIASTLATAAIYVVMSAHSSWRSGRVLSGPLLVACSTFIHFSMNGVLTGFFLLLWHQPAIWQNTARSGGLEEHLMLALFPVLPVALVLGLGGGILGNYGFASYLDAETERRQEF